MTATRREGSRGHANGKLYCRKTNIESAAGSAEGESSRCLLFILGPTRSVAGFLQRYGHADMFAVLHPHLCPPPSLLVRYGHDRRNSIKWISFLSFEYPKEGPRATEGGREAEAEKQIFVLRDLSDLKF